MSFINSWCSRRLSKSEYPEETCNGDAYTQGFKIRSLCSLCSIPRCSRSARDVQGRGYAVGGSLGADKSRCSVAIRADSYRSILCFSFFILHPTSPVCIQFKRWVYNELSQLHRHPRPPRKLDRLPIHIIALQNPPHRPRKLLRVPKALRMERRLVDQEIPHLALELLRHRRRE